MLNLSKLVSKSDTEALVELLPTMQRRHLDDFYAANKLDDVTNAVFMDEYTRRFDGDVISLLCWKLDERNFEMFKSNFNVFGSTPDGSTVLMSAIFGDLFPIINYLVDNAPPGYLEERSNDGSTAIINACHMGNIALVKKLIPLVSPEHLEERSLDGKTALHYATETGKKDLIIALAPNYSRKGREIKDNLYYRAQDYILESEGIYKIFTKLNEMGL